MKIIITITDISPNDAFYNDRDKYIGQKWEIDSTSLRDWGDGWFAFSNEEDNPNYIVFHEFKFDREVEMEIETILVYCPHEGLNRSLFLNYAGECVEEILNQQTNPNDSGVELLYSMLQTSSLWDDHTPALYDSLIIQFGYGLPPLIQLARDLGWRVEMISNFYDDPDFRPFG